MNKTNFIVNILTDVMRKASICLEVVVTTLSEILNNAFSLESKLWIAREHTATLLQQSVLISILQFRLLYYQHATETILSH